MAYKLVERGGQFLKVPAAGTSQKCSACGHRDPASRRDVAFVCTSCGWTGHADSNAAMNILNAAGLAVYGRGAETVGSRCEASTSRRAA
ncbi:zinc ribbon domain-containing protein [Micromonospora sp. NPDC005367]|uniref:zinc ribbon domain-containing protein n=1 Tax=Micromonospora sp. NPDC005367 TaxID=3155590 RepID=UPI0033A149E4